MADGQLRSSLPRGICGARDFACDTSGLHRIAPTAQRGFLSTGKRVCRPVPIKPWDVHLPSFLLVEFWLEDSPAPSDFRYAHNGLFAKEH